MPYGMRHILVIVCYFSRYGWAIPTEGTTSADAFKGFDLWVSNMGTRPLAFYLNLRSGFASTETVERMKSLDIALVVLKKTVNPQPAETPVESMDWMSQVAGVMANCHQQTLYVLTSSKAEKAKTAPIPVENTLELSATAIPAEPSDEKRHHQTVLRICPEAGRCTHPNSNSARAISSSPRSLTKAPKPCSSAHYL
ncbi:uncharacterized protein GGS25DRAFT_521406 [Hypoxylon fragiforme]|uniref:uncharacterized protein n=1 Tax=Hypoxylon fragiforme TaxID=63214 RepID=UPI0020C73D75|nr:uncharacterized protein GGS25DRAFT_521406 [Hypoxylon fragiforme]KAI2608232.1 hypothetical protein GGS25DRAFT_521406 [Hypoxylon fragiforme]